MIDNKLLCEETEKLHEYTIDLRRHFHNHPEKSGEEFDTRAYIEGILNEEGIPFEEVPDTSLIGTIDTGKPGPVIVLRTDIDALPMPESETNLKETRVCRSDRPEDRCHACGHDGHMAMMITAAKILNAHKDEMTGKIYLAFEEGEEDGRGWARLVEALEAKGPIDTCWAIHVYAGMPSGKLSVGGGPQMAGVQGINLKFKGKGGHGSRPDQSVNPVFCAANFMNNMAVAFANQIDANQTVTLGITAIKGGEVANVIPDDATVLGSMRFFSMKEGEKALKILEEVSEHTAAMHHCTVEPAEGLVLKQDPSVNDQKYGDLAEKAIAEVTPEDTVTKWEPWYASESFAQYLKRWPGVLCLLGIQNEEKGTGAPHHNTQFDIDEDVLTLGTLATVKYVLAVQDQFEG